MQDVPLSALLVVDDELHRDARAARPARIGRVAPVSGEITWIFREVRGRHPSSYTRSAKPCLARNLRCRGRADHSPLAAAELDVAGTCGIFATLQVSFSAATVGHKFSSPM